MNKKNDLVDDILDGDHQDTSRRLNLPESEKDTPIHDPQVMEMACRILFLRQDPRFQLFVWSKLKNDWELIVEAAKTDRTLVLKDRKRIAEIYLQEEIHDHYWRWQKGGSPG